MPSTLRMGRYRDKGDLALLGAIIPEYPVGCRGGLFGIRLEYLLPAGPLQTGEFMGLQAVVPRIGRQEANRLGHCLVPLLQRPILPQFAQLLPGLIRQKNLKHLLQFVEIERRDSARRSILQPLLHPLQRFSVLE